MFNTLPDLALRAGLRLRPLRRATLPTLSAHASEIVEAGERSGWSFRVLGRYPMPTAPQHIGAWWLVPADQDGTPLPPRAQLKLDMLRRAQLAPRGVIVAHEAPRFLSDGTSATPPLPWWRRQLLQLTTQPLLAGLVVVVLALLLPLLFELVVRSAVVLAGLVLTWVGLLGLGAVAVADPILIAVTDDDVWIELDRW